MKTRFILMMLILLLPRATVMHAGNDKPITVAQLPKKAQEFLDTHFREVKVSFSKVDNELFDKSYEVFFVNGGKVKFNKQGDWKEVECKYDQVPSGIVPEEIAAFIRERHPKNSVVEIERDRRSFDVKLNNGLEIQFDRKFNLIRYDD